MNESSVSQQLWRFAVQLRRELSEEPFELCWKRGKLKQGKREGTKQAMQKQGGAAATQDGSASAIAAEAAKVFAKTATESVAQDSGSAGSTGTVGQAAKRQETEKQEIELQLKPVLAGAESDGQAQAALEEYTDWREAILHCQACSLGKEKTRIRQQAIVGYPSSEGTAQLLLVCDAPSYDADQSGAPLDDSSLEYLRRWLEAIQLSKSYYLTNLVKCRPPGNRAAWPEELNACEKHLQKQMQNLKPKAILALGGSASRSLSRQRSDLDTLRQRNGSLFYTAEGIKIPLFVTYSVAEVLQNPSDLRPPVWQDLKSLRAFMNS